MAERPIPEIEDILAEHPSLLWHHCGNSRTCDGPRGLTDLFILGPSGRRLWRECKPNGQHPREGQVAWKYGLLAGGEDWGVWTPADVRSGRVRAEIEALL
jgi:hypothetical protein